MGIDPIGLATQHIKRVTVLHTTRARKCNILWKEGLKYTLSAMYESLSVNSICMISQVQGKEMFFLS